MADDIQKLQAFIEAALVDPRHPVFKMGMQHSPILQHYAVNVSMLGSIKPKQWFEEYPEHAQKLAEVMRLCEEDAAAGAAQVSELETLKSQVAALTAKLDELTKPKTDEPKTDETPPAGE